MEKPLAARSLFASDGKNLLDTPAAAKYLGIEPGTLEVWRCTKRYQIPYIKVGRLIRYREEALAAFLAKNTVDAVHP